MSLPAIFIEISAKIDGFEKAMGDVSNRLRAIDRDAEKTFAGFDQIGARLQSLGATLTAAISVPLLGAGAAATKFATDFDFEMRKVTSLISGTTQKDFEALSAQTLQLAKAIGVDAVVATKGLYEAISAGVPKQNAMAFLSEAATTAIAGTTQTAVAVDVLTTFMAAYGEKAKDTRKLSDALFQAVNVGKFQFEDLAKAIGPAAQQASSMGVSYTELLAATSTLSLSSGGVAEAVTQVKRAMQDLSDPSKEMKAALTGIGFASGTAAIKALGFEGTLEALRKRTGDNTEAFKNLFGRIEGGIGALALTGDHAKKAAEDLATLGHASDGVGAKQNALNEINKSTGNSRS
jgi:TP901 family phage tail tape measure protein